MSLPDGAYNSKEIEPEILKRWFESGVYKPEYDPKQSRLVSTEEMKADPRESWALICPPPNAYGRPHIGNISGYAYMDAMARYQRMKGKKVLVLPGKDHAGLEGEGVFVREVLEKQKRYKFDMKREDFYAEMMDFFMTNIDIARKDEKEIGLSADFDRDTFTLDPDIVGTVLDTFVEMYNAGMIYKGVRIVNWDPKARTAVADNQIEYEERQTPFYYFKYAFTQPEEKAINLKKEFKGKGTHWKVMQSNKELPYLMGERHDGVKVLGIAYDKVPEGLEVAGEVIGIQMRLDGDFRLVVKSNDFDGDINEELAKAHEAIFKIAAGSHIILFDEYTDDKYYTNGLIIGTVRPETIFADTAVACGMGDERYKDFVGKSIEVEFLGEKKKLNFIEDFAVDKDFGTGLLKVTPAHASEDWEIASRHPEECLPAIQVIGYDLRMNKLAGKYVGMKITSGNPEEITVRKAMIEDMKAFGNLVYLDNTYKNKIKIAERTKAPIEPLLSSQWYLKYDGIKEAAVDMVKNKEVTIHPESMEAKFNHWMENLRDWAISRSLWWGYRLPVWYHGQVKEEIGDDGQVRELISLSPRGEGNIQEWHTLEYGNPNHLRVQKESPGEGWFQDENVLDTWFSSGQWVYATLMKYDLMDTFFPTDVLVSGHDILENWDSRMMMFTYFKHKNIPFKNLFLLGLVLGKDGQKMSKSKGNVLSIDELREKYGTDAVRMVYYYQNSAGASYAMTYEKLDTFKKFVNKLWNASKFVLMNTEDSSQLSALNPNQLRLAENKALYEHILQTKEHITKNIDNFEFGLATYNLYHAFWHEFADIHIEAVKKYTYVQKDKETGAIISEPKVEDKAEAQQVLLFALKEYLKMLHPFMPFVTQRIWDEMPKDENDHDTLMYSKW